MLPFLILVKPNLTTSSPGSGGLGTLGHKYVGLRSTSGKSIDSKMKVSLSPHPWAGPCVPRSMRNRVTVTKRKLLVNKKSGGGLRSAGMEAVWTPSFTLLEGGLAVELVCPQAFPWLSAI